MPEVHAKREEQLHRQRHTLAEGMGAGGQILKGSLIERFTVCGRSGCRCMKGNKHGPYLYVSVFDGKQSRQVYVPQAMHAEVRAWLKNYQRLSATIGKLSECSVELIRLQQPKYGSRSAPAHRIPKKRTRKP